MLSETLRKFTDAGWITILGVLLLVAFALIKLVPEVLKSYYDVLNARRRILKGRLELSKGRLELSKVHRRAEIEEQNPTASSERVTQPYRTNSSRDVGAVVNTNFDILEKYYEQTLGENRLLSRSAIGVALLGFFVILVGVSLVFTGYTSVGVVSSIAGLLAEASTLMFFNQLREQVRQVQDYHKKLVSTQYLMTSIALAGNLRPNRRDTEIVRIISNLLFLSNELHGSKSDHLFSKDDEFTKARAPLPPTPSVERFPPPRVSPPAA